ncbi:GGDEF domain-containing protein [Allokutzneria sp. NRRL B-24872]|uniref:GGDEF domain-containing protein n=1 Tax=Allokutzneria sp. NRRL B-24872 TaxID=1137961 RepID=UPI00143CF215|nr:GGDEF domain-containing protein [Allokutzneria sp. NRRL B-24872]
MDRKRFAMVAATAMSSAFVVVVLTGFKLLPPVPVLALDNLAQLSAGTAGTFCCFWSARGRHGSDRKWRLLMGVGWGIWTLGQIVWTWYHIVLRAQPPQPSLADLGFLAMTVFVLVALLVFSDHRQPGSVVLPLDRRLTRARVVLVLDGLIVVGSLFILTWTTVMESMVRASSPSPLAFAVAIAYPLIDIVLLVIVVMLATIRLVGRRLPLAFIGLGMITLFISDCVFAYLISAGVKEIPALANFGYITAPVLFGLAALAPASAVPVAMYAAPPRRADGRLPVVEWVHVLMPYLPLVLTGSLILVRTAFGSAPGPLEIYLGLVVIALVVVRQLVTLVENMWLLDRIRQSQRQLEHQAFHDSLTGLANRVLFRDRLDHAIHLGARRGHPVTLLFADLDDFKIVNDGLGHAAGDALLRAIADRLRSCVRSTDTVARLGGDEFGILLDEAERADKIAERLLEALRVPFVISGEQHLVRASIGLVHADPQERGLTADVLLGRADIAMYSAKRHGKGTLVTYEPELGVTPSVVAPRLAGSTPA